MHSRSFIDDAKLKGLCYDHVPIRSDNTSVINLTKNPIQHSRTKHIEVRHYFIHDHMLRSNVVLNFVNTNNQLDDNFTKPLHENQFCKIRKEIGMIQITK